MAESLAEWIARTNAETEQLEIEQVQRLLAEERAAHEKTKQNRDTILTEKRIIEGKSAKVLTGTATELHILKADALDPVRYRAMKELAAKQGRTLKIVDGNAAQNPGTGGGTPFALDTLEDRAGGVMYCSPEYRDRPGVGPMRIREVARERGLTSATPVRYVEDLPEHMRQAYQQAVADRSSGGE